MRTPRFIQTAADSAADDRDATRAALLAEPASAAPKYFYDRLGSHLFEAITELPEYYPTRTEAAIFERRGAEIAQRTGSGITLIDLGAGNCAKATRLFPLLEPHRYVAVDISVDFLRDALRQVQREHPQTDIVGLGLDFSKRLDLPAELLAAAADLLLPGLEHRQLHAGRGARLPAPGPCAGERRRPGDRRRPRQGPARCSRRPTTTRSASPRRSTATCCAT